MRGYVRTVIRDGVAWVESWVEHPDGSASYRWSRHPFLRLPERRTR